MIANHPFYTDVEGKAWYIFKSLLIGLRFDNVVACYIMLIPLCVVALTSLLGLFRRAVMTGVNVFFQVMYIITFAIEAANIPYFKYFFNHLNSSIFNWMEYSDTTASMIFGETSYWVYLGILVAISWGWVRLTNHYLHQLKQAHARQGKFWQEVCMLPVSAILIGLTVIGLRGSVYVSPIRTGAAFFCNNPFFNQVGNHPMFNLVRSTLDLSSRETSNLALLDNEQALGNAMRYLHAERSGEGQAALTRQVKNDSAFAQAFPPTTFLFGGKAAPGYVNAKLIIKFINNIAHVINHDPAVRGRLAVYFMPNYRVTMAEHVIPCTNISEQISTAGLEASGTGNMKFMINGALTMGTLDGANVEIAQEVGDDNIFIFGHTEEEIAGLRKDYRPLEWVEKDEAIRRVIELVDSNHFNLNEPNIFEPLRRSLFDYGDKYCIFADLRMYHERHNEATDLYRDDFDLFNRKAILNIAASGKFSSDRTIQEYAGEIWHVKPCPVKKSTKDTVLEDAFNPLFRKEQK